jgi:hypothetical protein
MSRRFITIMGGVLAIAALVLTACGEPPDCPCNQIAVPNQTTFEWECVPVSKLPEPPPPGAYVKCPAAAATKEPVAPGIWAAAVCEPNNGFSSDGNLTLDTDVKNVSLMVAASADGPWVSAEVNGPQWVLTEATLSTLAKSLNVADFHNLWFKAGDAGQPALLQSMITNRAAKMGAICGD